MESDKSEYAGKGEMTSRLTLGKCFLLASISIQSYGVTLAANDEFITEQDVFGRLPVVSLVSRMEQPVDNAPASITVIDRELIEASGAQNWVDIFRLVPGFQAYSVNGNRYGVSYHGFGREFPNHLEVMVDGRSIYNPAFSTISWASLGLNINDVDHIEIVRGSSAPAHGSNAFLGAVNIVTHTPVQGSGTKLSATFGDRATREASIGHFGEWNELSYRASVHYRRNDGFPAVKDDPDGENGPMEDGTEQTSINLRGLYTPNLHDVFDLQLGFTHSRTGWGDVDHPDEYSLAEFDTHFQSLKWSHTLKSGSELQLHIYHNRLTGENHETLGMAHELLFAALGDALAQNIINTFHIEDQPVVFGFKSIKTERYDIELEHRLQLNDSLRATWGGAYRRESVQGTSLFNDNKTRYLNSRRLFVHGEWQLNNRWTLNAGTMAEDNNLVDSITSARLAVNYHLSPQQTLRFSVARGRRSPSLVEADEFNADFLQGDPDLLIQAIRRSVPGIKEERLTSYELGYIGHFPELGLTFDAHLFLEKMRDGLEVFQALVPAEYAVLDPDDSFSTRSNNLEADISGIELQLRYRPTSNTFLAAHYSYRDVDSTYIAINEPGIFRLRDHNQRAPRHTASLVVSQKLTDALTASINTYHMNEADWRDGNAVDEFTRIDAQISYQIQAGNTRGKLSLIGQNLGEDYSEHGRNNIFDTRIYLKFELELP